MPYDKYRNWPLPGSNLGSRFPLEPRITLEEQVLKDLADAKDDRHNAIDVLGNIKMGDDSVVRLNRLPVVYINQLDDVTDLESGKDATAYAPLYCVDFEKFIPYVQDGYWMEETEPMTDRTQHTTFTIFLDGSHNNLCVNRRQAGFVIHKPIVA